jgi:hypothetical protein
VVSTYAAHGYIVVTPDHLGYDTFSLTYHPYLLGEAQAIEVVDGLRAARDYLNAPRRPQAIGQAVPHRPFGGRLRRDGDDKVIQRDYQSEFKVAGSVPISGPYNLVGMGDVIASGLVNMGGTVYISLLLTAYQKAHGNIYHQPSDIYQSPYDATIEGLFPTDADVSTLVAQGKLPAFDPTMNNLFGLGGLMKPTFACGFANSNFRKALVTNTLAGRDGTTEIKWSPNHPMALCGGQNDPMVFWGVNAPVAAQVLSTRALPVAVYNLEDRNSLPPSSRALYDGFQQAKIADFFGVLADYHGVLLPRYCHALARSFFESL